ncbi:MAG: DUF2497 domain-containing protein [Pseudolabrys sp.]|nr:DUF2497 domain-containing protein [Pseudolabrys sp.]
MSQAAKAEEPSMEEILASIRRIIADDDVGKQVKTPDPPAASPPLQGAPAAANSQQDVDAMLAALDKPATAAAAGPTQPTEILELTEAMAASPPRGDATSGFRTIEPGSDVVFTEPHEEPPSQPPPRAFDETRMTAARAARSERPLLSPATAAAVDSAFNSLANTVLGANARTLEDLVKEMLRPMLKTWLDDNLPSLVERIVRDEIERVSRGRH